MKTKFSKFERVAGVFVLAAIVGTVAATVGIAVQKGWFASKVEFKTVLTSAAGVHSGTVVQVAGLRAGSVEDVELVSANEVNVTFRVFKRFHDKIKQDSDLQVIRPFIVGEKVFEVSVGSDESPILPAGSVIQVKNSVDIMDLMSGRKLAPFLGTMEKLTANLTRLAEAFTDAKRTEALIEMFDKLNPFLNNMNRMSKRIIKVSDIVTNDKRLETMVVNLAGMTTELNKILPQITKDSPEIGTQITSLVSNLSALTAELTKLTPAISAIAPELPGASKRALEALDETVVTLKAIQKSFLLRGSVEDVREEEAKRRKPAKEGKN